MQQQQKSTQIIELLDEYDNREGSLYDTTVYTDPETSHSVLAPVIQPSFSFECELIKVVQPPRVRKQKDWYSSFFQKAGTVITESSRRSERALSSAFQFQCTAASDNTDISTTSSNNSMKDQARTPPEDSTTVASVVGAIKSVISKATSGDAGPPRPSSPYAGTPQQPSLYAQTRNPQQVHHNQHHHQEQRQPSVQRRRQVQDGYYSDERQGASTRDRDGSSKREPEETYVIQKEKKELAAKKRAARAKKKGAPKNVVDASNSHNHTHEVSHKEVSHNGTRAKNHATREGTAATAAAKSPERAKSPSKSQERSKTPAKSPERAKSPAKSQERSKSPEKQRHRSPEKERHKSPKRHKSPSKQRAKSPGPSTGPKSHASTGPKSTKSTSARTSLSMIAKSSASSAAHNKSSNSTIATRASIAKTTASGPRIKKVKNREPPGYRKDPPGAASRRHNDDATVASRKKASREREPAENVFRSIMRSDLQKPAPATNAAPWNMTITLPNVLPELPECTGVTRKQQTESPPRPLRPCDLPRGSDIKKKNESMFGGVAAEFLSNVNNAIKPFGL